MAPLWAALLLTAAAAPAPPELPGEGACGAPEPGMACVAGGPFLRGRDDGPKDERPRESVDLGPFWMDLTEVTVADYRACREAGACEKAGPNYLGFSEPAMPITGVSWFQAAKFCAFKGKRLPSEAEWEKAARGADGRLYPWGDERATCARAIIKEGEPNGCGRGKIWPVGSRPANPYGLYDMAGNVHEWVADWYAPSYAACGKDCRGKDPRGPCAGALECPGFKERVVRGGSWYWDASWATATRRRAHVPQNRPFHHFGFRCAKDARR